MLKIIRKFLRFCEKKERNQFVLSIVLNLFYSMFEALKIKAIYDFLTAYFVTGLTRQTAVDVLIVMGISIVGSGILKNKMTLLQTEAGYITCANKRMDIAKHLRDVPMGYFNENSLGRVVSITTNTLQSLENIATRVIMLVAAAVLNTFVITLFIIIFDYRIGLILLAGIAIFAVINSALIKKSGEIAQKKDIADEKLVSEIIEYIEGIFEVKSYNLTKDKARSLNDANRINKEVNLKMEMTFVPFICAQVFVIKLIGIAMIAASVYFYIDGSLSIVNTIVMIIASFLVYASLESANAYTSLLRNVDICVNKVNSVMEFPVLDLAGSVSDFDSLAIEGENLEFSYDSKKIIDGVSFKIPEKTHFAIVGPSGGGKTTLTKLISRFFDVDGGIVKMGGKNIKDYNYDAFMKHFSFVFQNVYLFNDTIANNIRFGKPDASMDEVIEAAKKARCHEFIESLPDGYDSVIGSGGINLSGGERQRISIARAMMKDAGVVILDEATANVDPENEEELISAINELTKEKTVIMIAHRLKTVRDADEIIVVEKGRITESGTHEELIKQGGLYKRFIDDRKKAVSWKI